MKYKRIAGSRKGLGKWCSLWLGDDHLLAVCSTGYSEEYTRYYLKDIQAIIARRTARGKVWNVLLSSALAVSLFAVISTLDGGVTSATVTAGFFAVLFCIPLLYNIIRGPTCKCHIRMPLGVCELPSLDRLKTVEKALARIRPLVSRLQGSVSNRDILQLTSNAPVEFSSPSAPVMSVSAQKGNSAASGYNGRFHYMAFSVLLVTAVFSIVQIFLNNRPLMALSAFLNLLLLASIILALVSQYGHQVPRLPGKLIWGALITMVTGGVYIYFFAIIHAVPKIKGTLTSHYEILGIFADIKPMDYPALSVFALCYAVLSFCIGTVGLVSYGKAQRVTGGVRRTVRNIPVQDSDL